MSKRKFVFIVGLFFALAGCQGAGSQQQLEAIEAQLQELSEKSDTSALEEQLATLSMQVSEAAMQDQVFQVNLANYAIESAGFHAIDESINGEGVIEPEFLGTVNRVRGLLAGTNWPDALQADLVTLQRTLEDLSDTLAADDIDGAGPLAGQAHDQQHDFSAAAALWVADHASGMARDGGMEHDDGHDHNSADGSHEHGDRIPNEGSAAIRIVSLSDGDMFSVGEDIVVEVEVTDFALGENGSHWHGYVNGESFGMVVGGTLSQVLSGLEAGQHEVSAYLANGDHEEFEEGAMVTIMVHEN